MNPQSPAPQPAAPNKYSPSDIYPDASKNLPKQTSSTEKNKQARGLIRYVRSIPIGVMIIAVIEIFSAIFYLLDSAKISNILIAISGLQILLGIALLWLRETARRILVILLVINLILSLPRLASADSAGLIFISVSLVAIIYLNLPHVKDHFS